VAGGKIEARVVVIIVLTIFVALRIRIPGFFVLRVNADENLQVRLRFLDRSCRVAGVGN
jgi:hypothetical protein